MRPLLRLPNRDAAPRSSFGVSVVVHAALVALAVMEHPASSASDETTQTERIQFIAPENTSPPPSAAQLAAQESPGDGGESIAENERPDGWQRAGARSNAAADLPSAASAAQATANVLGVDARADRVFRVLEVDEAAARDPESGGPVYPEALQRRGIEGWVVARFVVDTAGMAVPGTLTIVSTTSSDFTRAVTEAMPSMRFLPALRRGRKVKSETELTFRFRMALAQNWSEAAPQF